VRNPADSPINPEDLNEVMEQSERAFPCGVCGRDTINPNREMRGFMVVCGKGHDECVAVQIVIDMLRDRVAARALRSRKVMEHNLKL
jgi:hypothetical protein